MPDDEQGSVTALPELTLFLCGDVMTGRGIDQVLSQPGAPKLYESYVKNASDYVTLAERRNGPIPKPVSSTYIWGDALEVLSDVQPDLQVINLETSNTVSNEFWLDKSIHYRMAPRNVSCLRAMNIDCCVLANNHVLDWGYPGLHETLATLGHAGFSTSGAGQNIDMASRPARITVAEKGNVLVFGLADRTSGVPQSWSACKNRAGVNLLRDLSPSSASRVTEAILAAKNAGDTVIASIPWGENWGYEIPTDQTDFAHHLIDMGAADIVHGHSSHHPKAVEIYQHKPIIYGCGDFLNDYEGIGGYEEYRPWFSLMYFVTLNLQSGYVESLEIVPLCVRRMTLEHAKDEGRRWLVKKLNTLGKEFSTQFTLINDRLVLAEPSLC